ncbi:MAG TPA: hypothetical protein VFJ51_13000, partial [Nitrososphaeraceae archaeon]|nr:hypothetical protein [Nitrososphaeraceae archaeon]
VIDLYYNQRKNVLQIAQKVRISFRDIAAILKKKESGVNDGDDSGNGIVLVEKQQQLGNVGSQSTQKSTQAYKLFSEGKKPVEEPYNWVYSKSKQQDTIENTGNSKDSTS